VVNHVEQVGDGRLPWPDAAVDSALEHQASARDVHRSTKGITTFKPNVPAYAAIDTGVERVVVAGAVVTNGAEHFRCDPFAEDSNPAAVTRRIGLAGLRKEGGQPGLSAIPWDGRADYCPSVVLGLRYVRHPLEFSAAFSGCLRQSKSVYAGIEGSSGDRHRILRLNGQEVDNRSR